MVTLGDSIADGMVSIFTGPFGSALHSHDYVDVGVPVVPTEAIVSGRLDSKFFPRIKKEKADELSRYELRPGDLVFARRGAQACGLSAMVDEECKGAIAGTGVIVARINNQTRIDPKYFSILVGAPSSVAWLKTHAVGATMPNLNSGIISALPVSFPPLPEQKAIAHILGTLDDKIELNRRMNATLEAMARALFQSWFVDFDPVHAKAASPSGLSDEALAKLGIGAPTAGLFPAAFQDSALGEIPKGWDVGRLDDALVLQRGFDLPASERTHGNYPVMAASGPNGCHDKFMVKGPGVTTGRSGVLGKVFFIHGDFWPLNTSLWVKEFKRVSPTYAFHLLRGLDFEGFNAGSAVPTLNRNHVHNLSVVIPPKSIVEAFDAQVIPLMQQQHTNENQSRTLATLRDTLLPKLLTGELSSFRQTTL